MELEPALGWIHADRTMFQQAIINLCVNARDAMPSGGTLTLKTENVTLDAAECQVHANLEPGRYSRLSVNDTGTGIPPEVLNHIFEPFFTTKEIGKGTGLGLAMVYGVVKQHHGVIRVQSEVGQGTTFEISLPVSDPQDDDVPEAPGQHAAGGSETILVADDEPVVREASARILRAAGYRVLTASDGAEAVATFRMHAPAIALLVFDMAMPKLGGRDAYDQICQIKADVPIIYCTGYDSVIDQPESAAEESLCLVAKPFDPETLLATVREVLDRSASCPAH
jgi:two-component system, cell cycle sensor histidine kinase and response regulator CckA